jgi:hypothetical protein
MICISIFNLQQTDIENSKITAKVMFHLNGKMTRCQPSPRFETESYTSTLSH